MLNLIQMFVSLRRYRFRSETACASNAAAWRRDPLCHPDIRKMSERELSDLPFDPALVAEI
jgi:hypothetical protein